MHNSVLPKFRELTTEFEGRVTWPYLDVKGLVTVGLGCLIDPVQRALGLPWLVVSEFSSEERQSIDKPLSRYEVQVYLERLKVAPPAKPATFYRDVTPLRLSEQAIDDLADRRAAANERYLAKLFPEWDQWPADAQLGTMLLAWATGCGFDLLAKRGQTWAGNFVACVEARTWWNVPFYAEVPLRNNPTGRLEAIRLCFENANDVDHYGGNPAKLHYPNRTPSLGSQLVQPKPAEPQRKYYAIIRETMGCHGGYYEHLEGEALYDSYKEALEVIVRDPEYKEADGWFVAECLLRDVSPNLKQRVLRPADYGNDVSDLRRYVHLSAIDFDLFDRDLTDIIKILQRHHDLEVDGVVGPKTRKAIGWRP